MKRSMTISAALLILCMSFAITGCGDKKSESTGSGCEFDCPGVGYGFDLPKGLELSHGFIEIKDLGDVDYDSGVMTGWPGYYDLTEKELEENLDNLGSMLHVGHSFTIICVQDVNSEEAAKEKAIDTIIKMNGEISDADRESINSYKMIHQENGYVWLYTTEDKATDIREESKAEYDAFYDATEEIISNMKFYTPTVWHGSEEGTTVSFETVDLNGNPISSEALFAQNKVTMINIWATTCGPCIEEMPELEEINREFQEKGGAIVGLVDDVWMNNTKYLDEAQAIVEDTGVTYMNLCAWDGYDDVLQAVATPTTYFVNSQGKILGNPIMGASPIEYRARMEEYLSLAP